MEEFFATRAIKIPIALAALMPGSKGCCFAGAAGGRVRARIVGFPGGRAADAPSAAAITEGEYLKCAMGAGFAPVENLEGLSFAASQ